MRKKRLLLLAVFALVLSVVIGCGQSSSNESTGGNANGDSSAEDKVEDELIVAGNVDYAEVMQDVVFKRFQEKYPGIKISYVPGNGSQTIAKVKAQKASPQIDVAIMDNGPQEDGRKEGLWETLDNTDVPNLDKVVSGTKPKDNSGVPISHTPHGVSYNTKLAKERGIPVMTSWNDLTLPEMKGNLAINDITSSFGRTILIMLAYANGGSEKEIDPGFKKYAIIAANQQTFYKNQSEISQALQEGRAVYTVWSLNRHHQYKSEELPLEFIVPKEGTVHITNYATMVKGAKHPNAAKKFIDFLLTDEIQQLFAEKIYYSPVTDVKLSPELAQKLEFDTTKAVPVDYEVINANFTKWLEKFNKEVASQVGKEM